ncbi:MAG: hypothetical protein H6Q90_4777 [Deltaproteobacteria bacterium]|nr:hypothetical protein [Deltaproteobacteria bacterium]
MNRRPVRILFLTCLALIACQGRSASSEPSPERRVTIEVKDAHGKTTARVVSGHPCRATVDGIELLVGGRPLVAQVGETVWNGNDAANGTTLSQNGHPVARIHANQLFDSEGVPLVRVMDNGDIGNPAGQIVRKAVITASKVTIGDVTVTGTSNVALAAMLTAPEVNAEIRALAACHYLLPADPSEEKTP